MQENSSTEITELKKALQLRDTFISVCAHELRTPLTSLKLMAEYVKRKQLSPAEMNQLLDKMDTELDRAVKLVDEMSDVSRVTTGRLTLRPEVMNFKNLIEQALMRLKPQIGSGAHEIQVKAEDVLVVGDPVRLEQALLNLITNAMKYGNGKPIHISTERQVASASISVRDEGMGISQKDLTRIFDCYERVSDEQAPGLGLGLFIAKEIMAAHKGRLHVVSSLGMGSTFTLEIPLTFGLRTKFPASN